MNKPFYTFKIWHLQYRINAANRMAKAEAKNVLQARSNELHYQREVIRLRKELNSHESAEIIKLHSVKS